MIGLAREATKALLVETQHLNNLRQYLMETFEAREYDLEEAFENAGEEATVVVLCSNMDNVSMEKGIKNSFVIQKEPETVLSQLINDGQSRLIEKVRTASKTIFLRAMGNLEKVFEKVKNDYDGIEAPFLDILKRNREDGVILALTEKPLNRIIKLKDLYKEKCLLINEDYYKLFKELRVHGLKYLNVGLENNVWYDMEIRIYDKYGAYKKHFDRLMMVLDALELGLTMGHSWGKDYPRVLLSVDVYSVRFFTFFEPKYIKGVLLGLEHLGDGTRIVDYDLFYNKDKIYWRSMGYGKNETRGSVSKRYRDEIISKLTGDEVEELLELEEEILLTRK